MKIAALILGVLGGIGGVALWFLSTFLVPCACPHAPGYPQPTYIVDLLPLMNTWLGLVAIASGPVALISAVLAILAVLPRFQGSAVPRLEIMSGLFVAVSLVLLITALSRPRDMTALFLGLLAGVVPGLLLVAGGILARRTQLMNPTS